MKNDNFINNFNQKNNFIQYNCSLAYDRFKSRPVACALVFYDL